MARYYQKQESIKTFLNKKKTKSENLVARNIKIFLIKQKRKLAEYRKKIYYKIWKNKTASQIKSD